MTKITIATFNVENLFTRYDFRGKKQLVDGQLVRKPLTKTELAKASKNGLILNPKIMKTQLRVNRKLTADAIKALKADIVGLQEVESQNTLKIFNSRYLKRKKFAYPLVIDGNDRRYIDVGVLSHYPIDFVRTHQYTKSPSGRSLLFSRDCLEAHINIGDTSLPIFVNHFTSMMRGRQASRKRRTDQANGVIDILIERFGQDYQNADFVILGDFNDFLEAGKGNESGMTPLLDNDKLVNVVNRLPVGERWTHYYEGDHSYRQLDYILLSKSLADKNPDVLPVIERRGQSRKVNLAGEPLRVKTFFEGVTKSKKASDHCPVAITINV